MLLKKFEMNMTSVQGKKEESRKEMEKEMLYNIDSNLNMVIFS